MLPSVSKTFHGRDVFAPVAANFAKGRLPSDVGLEIGDYCVPSYAKSALKANSLFGEVLHVDDFGNVITSFSEENLDKLGAERGVSLRVRFGRKTWLIRYCSAYGEVDVGELVAVIGSHGFLEIAANQSSAVEKLRAKTGMNVQVSVT